MSALVMQLLNRTMESWDIPILLQGMSTDICEISMKTCDQNSHNAMESRAHTIEDMLDGDVCCRFETG